jgi:hypothetical protein
VLWAMRWVSWALRWAWVLWILAPCGSHDMTSCCVVPVCTPQMGPCYIRMRE